MKLQHLAERREAAVVQVRRSLRHAAQARDAKLLDHFSVAELRSGRAGAAIAFPDKDLEASLRGNER